MIEIPIQFKNSLSNHNYIDLFAGIGGFHLAFESFGAKCVFVSEWDKHAQAVYKDNFNITPAGDITIIEEKDVPTHDIICAGFPCQAFSVSGKQLGFNDTRGTLFFDVARIAKYHMPKLLFLENVKNFLSHDNGNTIKVVVKTLNDIGYDVFYKLLNAGSFGVPQNRERIYILAFRKDLKVEKFEFPLSINCPSSLNDFLQPDEDVSEFVISHKEMQLKNSVKFKEDLFGNGPQMPVRIGQVNKGGQGDRIYHPGGHAITLSAYGGGVGAKTGLYVINNKLRKLSPRECANLMGFPSSFKISKIKSQAYKQFGNGVVVNVLQAIIKKIISENLL